MYCSIGGWDVEVVVHDPRATEADLAEAAGLPPPDRARPLTEAGLTSGQTFGQTFGAHPPDPPRHADLSMAVVGGLDSGARVAVDAGNPVSIGRAEENRLAVDDLTVSRRHARVEAGLDDAVRYRDLGSRNGSWLVGDDGEHLVPTTGDATLAVGAEVRIGASRVALIVPVGDAPVGGPGRAVGVAGTVPHNRPPRAAPPPSASPIPAPVPPVPAGRPLPLGVVAVVGPIAMAVAMIALLGNPAFALFALLAPVLAVGNHVEGRRRARTGSRRDAARWRAEVERFAAALTGTTALELARRRAACPDPAEVVRRAAQPSTRLWERRPGHDDWLHLRVGTGAVPWDPPVVDGSHGPRHPDLATAVAAVSTLGGAPVTIELGGGGVVGIVGPRPASLAVARSLLGQAAVHHGPADLPMFVACGSDAAGEWDWTKWLPHVHDASGGPRRLAAGREAADAFAQARMHAPSDPPETGTLLVVVDGDGLLSGRRAPLRSVLEGRSGPVAGIVLAPSADRLPACCRAVVAVAADGGDAELLVPSRGLRLASVAADGIGDATARACARALLRYEDPELDDAGAGLPPVVRLLALLGLDPPAPADVAARWAMAAGPGRAVTPIGLDGQGVVDVDLDADGPHALVAGTTGAGKSELLRTLVAGLAASADPDQLTFVLVDFKGGSAFDACARLPHTVGLVTDLDAGLARRALRCLEAELRHRERCLRAAGATDLASYRRVAATSDEHGPLPRLVVVVDEFATLKAELPDFVDALVGVAQRGRSLGVHLVLATQRPGGSVSDHIKANTNLRIALRVQDTTESMDVLDAPDAATLPRTLPGRACVRLGSEGASTMQTAMVSGRPPAGRRPVELRAFAFGPGPPAPTGDGSASGEPADLDVLVDACATAWAAAGRPAPRRPWPEPLPRTIDVGALDAAVASAAPDGELLPVGLADDPDRQRRLVAGWRPCGGNLLLQGTGGSGTTTTALAVARALVATVSPDRVQLFAIDHGAGELGVLAGLPHVAAVIGAADLERQARLVRHLRAELDRRRATPPASRARLPRVVLLIDGVSGFLAAFDDVAGMEVADAFGRLVADGPDVGIGMVLTADRAGALPATLAATVRQRWIHRAADPVDASAAGLPIGSGLELATAPPGRLVDVSTGLAVQVAVPSGGWEGAFAAIGARWPEHRATVPAAAVGTLPDVVDLDALGTGAELEGRRPWTVPIGLADDDLAPVHLPLHPGDHVLVAGPGRSGRTTALASMAVAVHSVRPDAVVVSLVARRSWLDQLPMIRPAPSVLEAVAAIGAAAADGLPSFLLVDDAEGVEDVDGALAGLLRTDRPEVHVLAAGRAEVLRTLYAHWTRTVRRSRLGVLLRPQAELDGELLGATLPRRSRAPFGPGRGYLVVDGAPTLVQVARVAGSGR